MLAGRAAVVTVYTAAMCMNGLDSTIVNPALFSIAEDFGRPVSAANAVETAFLVGLALGLPVAGWLGDRYGVKRVFLGALSAFTLASALCAAAPGLGSLAAARAVQGVAGGLLTPVGMTLLFRAFAPHERAGLGRILIVPTALMPALGPPLGGFLTEHLSWHWLFLVNVPIGAAAVAIGLLGLRGADEPPAGRFDTTGFLLATPGLGLLTYALGFGPAHGWTSPGVALGGIAGLALLGAAVRHQLRTGEPLVDLRLLADRAFGAASWLALLTAAGLMGALFALPLLYQAALGASALDAGLSVFPEAVGLMAASQVVDRLLPRLGPRRLALPALLLAAAVLAGLGYAENPWLVRALMFGVGLILGTAVLTVQIAGFADVPPPAMGRAMGLFTILRTLGGALGIAATAALIGAWPTDAGPTPYRLALLLTATLVAAATLLATRLPTAPPGPPPED
ncbi:DHA2 family efflux MFS transporter permease subunit [Kitasatospora xanthocidica]|uniref:DHA2 family efflux MFS transporter permease subunit n=1 Tax=Kitasatospora xanthocidica TaxID=83382 RepID=UPI001E34066A|nr:DHA2 family efflux MFS transporter permease subunit [Kitasatospora xanthocidica]